MITFSTRIGPGYGTTPTFEAMRFPAGDAHIKVVNENDGKGPLTEIARIDSIEDLDLLGMWSDAAGRRNAITIAHIPYLPGARQDRGVPFGAFVYAGIINSFGIEKVVMFDPHSPVMPNLIHNSVTITSTALIRKHVVGRVDRDDQPQRYTGIIAPDAGAVERAQHVADACHLPLYKAEKHRDETTGKLSGFSCEPLPEGGRYLVVDDICDGGGTFAGLAEATGLGTDQLGLFVSHGVFSGQAMRLHDHFGEIVTTDSYPSLNNVADRVIPLAPYLHLV